MASLPHRKPTKVTSAAGEAPLARPAYEARSPRAPPRAREVSYFRFPIALKFAALIAALVVAAMAWQTYTATHAAGERLEEDTNQSGVTLATVLAALVGEGKGLQALSGAPGAEAVLNIVVYDQRGAAIATAKGESLFHVTRGTPIADPKAVAAGVDINEFDYEGVPVRGFAKPIPGGAPAGRVEVYLSAARIAESRRKLAEAMTRVSATACLLAAAGAFLLARFLTRPIRVLVKDMKQVSQGNLQHQSRVNSSDELGDLARAFNAMTGSLQAAQDAKIAQRSLEHELSLATAIQTRLLPTAIPEIEGFDISAYCLSAREVGGDYYDFVTIDPDHAGMVVADVSGKGVPASLIMTMTRSLLRAAAAGETSPAKTVETVNRFLSPDMNPGMFVTLLYVVLDTRGREVRLARCGHNAPLLYNARSGKLIALQPRGIGLGLDRTGSLFRSELQVQRFTLQPGDVLLAFTDGVIEAKNRAGEDYTEERLKEVFAAHASEAARELVEAILKDLDRHRRGAEQSDDITILAVRCLPGA